MALATLRSRCSCHPPTRASSIWGVGPVFTVPSASDPILGTGKVLVGPTAVLLITPGHWVLGVLLNNQWSVGGNPLRPAVNAFLAQPFVNYNMAQAGILNYITHHHRRTGSRHPVRNGPCQSAAASVACSRWMINR